MEKIKYKALSLCKGTSSSRESSLLGLLVFSIAKHIFYIRRKIDWKWLPSGSCQIRTNEPIIPALGGIVSAISAFSQTIVLHKMIHQKLDEGGITDLCKYHYVEEHERKMLRFNSEC
jgi:hypothetical protein